MACYFECLPLEASLGSTSALWSTVLLQLENLYRRILLFLSALEEITPLLQIMVSVLKIPVIAQFKVLISYYDHIWMNYVFGKNLLHTPNDFSF